MPAGMGRPTTSRVRGRLFVQFTLSVWSQCVQRRKAVQFRWRAPLMALAGPRCCPDCALATRLGGGAVVLCCDAAVHVVTRDDMPATFDPECQRVCGRLSTGAVALLVFRVLRVLLTERKCTVCLSGAC